MCGSSKQENTVNNAQTQLLQTMQANYQAEFAQNQKILDNLTSTLTPLLQAGPSQQGYSPAEIAALNTNAAESAAATYRNTAEATNEAMMARGGGNSFVPSGAQEQVQAGIGVAAENQLAAQKLNILENSFNQGQKNFDFAVGALAGSPGALQGAATSAGTAAVGAGGAAMQGAEAINQADNSWMGLVGGIAGGLAGNPKLFG